MLRVWETSLHTQEIPVMYKCYTNFSPFVITCLQVTFTCTLFLSLFSLLCFRFEYALVTTARVNLHSLLLQDALPLSLWILHVNRLLLLLSLVPVAMSVTEIPCTSLPLPLLLLLHVLKSLHCWVNEFHLFLFIQCPSQFAIKVTHALYFSGNWECVPRCTVDSLQTSLTPSNCPDALATTWEHLQKWMTHVHASVTFTHTLHLLPLSVNSLWLSIVSLIYSTTTQSLSSVAYWRDDLMVD